MVAVVYYFMLVLLGIGFVVSMILGAGNVRKEIWSRGTFIAYIIYVIFIISASVVAMTLSARPFL